jgi:hypothetical protein
MDLDLTDATGSGADVVKVAVRRVKPPHPALSPSGERMKGEGGVRRASR